MKKFYFKVAFVLFAVSCMIQEAAGSGFTLYSQGTKSLGQGTAVVAHNDDASALFFNPALMNKLGQSQMKAGITVIPLFSVDFRSASTGRTFELEDEVHYLPTLYTTYVVNEKVTAGLGVFSNFGLSTKWADDWEGRYLATDSELKTYTFNPAVSVRVLPNIYVAGGVDILYLDAELNKNINLSSFMLPDVKQRMSGDDTGFGFNLGMLIDITEDISFGASYRSNIDVDVDGRVDHVIPAAVVTAGIAPLIPDTAASTTVHLPSQVFVGLAYSGIESLVFEIGGKWEEWSRFDELRIKLEQPILTFTESVSPRNWKDVYVFSIGAQYQISRMFDLNAGYMYEPTPIPDDTFEPAVPDNDAHVFGLSTDIHYNEFTFGLLYVYKKYEDRVKNNSLDDNLLDGFNPLTSANGRYESVAHLIGFDISYVF